MFLKLSPKTFCFCISAFLIAGCLTLDNPHTILSHYQRLRRQYDQKIHDNTLSLQERITIAKFFYQFNDLTRVRLLLEPLDSIEAKVLLVKAYAKMQEYDHAISLFEEIESKALPTPYALRDEEYYFLYARVLEEKNLFSQALKQYEKVTGSYADLANERIQQINTRGSGSVPQFVIDLLQEAAPFIEAMQDEAAVILWVDETMAVTEDNKSEFTVHVIKQILKERGKELAEVQIGYDSTYETVELLMARTITREGQVIHAGDANVRNVSRYLNFPLYSNARALIVSMPMAEVGALIEYKVKITTAKLIDEENFNFVYRLRENYPIYKAKFQLAVPQQREIKIKYFNEQYAGTHHLSPEIRQEGRTKVYEWEFSQVEPLIPEYNMPPYSQINPAFMVSSFTSWDDIYQWWRGLYRDKLTLDEPAQEFTRSLVAGAKDARDKARRIYEFCAQHIRYVAVEYGQSGYEPHTAQEVLLNRYGDCKDQSILLMAMLKEVGLQAYPVLIPTRAVYPMDTTFPTVHFNHAICAVQLGEELVFMDPTGETTSFGDLPLDDQDRDVFVCKPDQWSIVRTPVIEDNSVEYTMEITLTDQEHAQVTRSVTTTGFFSAAHRQYLKYSHPEKIKEDLQQKIVEIAATSILRGYTIEHVEELNKSPLLQYSFSADSILIPAGNLRIYPSLDEIKLSPNLIGKDARLFPLDFKGIFSKRTLLTVRYPAALRVKYVPKDVELDTAWFHFQAIHTNKEQVLHVEHEFKVKKQLVTQEEYAQFKSSLQEMFSFLLEAYIFERVPPHNVLSP